MTRTSWLETLGDSVLIVSIYYETLIDTANVAVVVASATTPNQP